MKSASMTAQMIVECLLDPLLVEATVRLPPRGTRWIAVYTGPMPGKQVWRSTGLRDRDAAMALARRWEAEARQQRAMSGAPRKPTMRVRRGSGEAAAGLLTQEEAAVVLRLSVRAIRNVERRAIEKLRRGLRRFWREHVSGDVEETSASDDLLPEEVAALFNLTTTPMERQALKRVLAALLTGLLLDT